MGSVTVTKRRCSWASVDGPMLLQYHDREWGVPVHNDREHFEVLVLWGTGRIELVARAEKAGRLSPRVRQVRSGESRALLQETNPEAYI